MTTTFIVEWDFDDLTSLILAEEALRMKTAELRKAKFELADRLDCEKRGVDY